MHLNGLIFEVKEEHLWSLMAKRLDHHYLMYLNGLGLLGTSWWMAFAKESPKCLKMFAGVVSFNVRVAEAHSLVACALNILTIVTVVSNPSYFAKAPSNQVSRVLELYFDTCDLQETMSSSKATSMINWFLKNGSEFATLHFKTALQ